MGRSLLVSRIQNTATFARKVLLLIMNCTITSQHTHREYTFEYNSWTPVLWELTTSTLDRLWWSNLNTSTQQRNSNSRMSDSSFSIADQRWRQWWEHLRAFACVIISTLTNDYSEHVENAWMRMPDTSTDLLLFCLLTAVCKDFRPFPSLPFKFREVRFVPWMAPSKVRTPDINIEAARRLAQSVEVKSSITAKLFL